MMKFKSEDGDVAFMEDGAASDDENDGDMVVWLHRQGSGGDDSDDCYTTEDEAEKASSDRTSTSVSPTNKFSKVYRISSGGFVSIPRRYTPSAGSPSGLVRKDPLTMKCAFQSTFRIMSTFQPPLPLGEVTKTMFGTGFAVSPLIAMTAKHCVQRQGETLLKLEGCEGNFVDKYMFDVAQGSGWECQLVECTLDDPRWKVLNCEGLHVSGADVGNFRCGRSFDTFLLPCSPSFLSDHSIAILSYPAVNGFMDEATKELQGEQEGKIWQLYEPAMHNDLEALISHMATSKKLSIEEVRRNKRMMSRIKKEIKCSLLQCLAQTFGRLSSGTMVCSVGTLLCANEIGVGTSASTLRGSSGAAVCPLEFPGYFIGVHAGGSQGFDMNGATSTDNKNFVSLYVKNVLPTLPPPDDECWLKWRDNLGPFFGWLDMHIDKDEGRTPWHTIVQLNKQPVA